MNKRWIILGLLAYLAGCSAPRAGEPVTHTFGGLSDDDQLNFWQTLNDRALTSNDDAAHGLLLLFTTRDDAQTYEQRVLQLKGLGLYPANFSKGADLAVERGDVAFAIARGLHLRGGWLMSLMGTTRRYALRELEYDGLFPHSSPNQLLTGAEFVGIIGKIEDYQQGHPEYTPATQVQPTTRGAP